MINNPFGHFFSDIQESSKSFVDYRNVVHIGQRIPKRFLYKYMDIESAITSFLNRQQLLFVEPSVWQDKFETRFYNADYSNVVRVEDKARKTPRLYASCFTSAKTSEPAWKMYSCDNAGRAAYCVQFKFNLKHIREVLDAYAEKTGGRVYEGSVLYGSEYEISNLHYRTIKGQPNPCYDQIFSKFTRLKYLGLLLLKREMFDYEKEQRFFIVPKSWKSNSPELYVDVDLSQLLEEVSVTSDCPREYVEDIRKALDAAGCNLPVLQKDLYSDGEENRIIIGDIRTV